MEDFDFDVLAVLVLQFHVVAGVLAEEHFVTDVQELRWVDLVLANAARARTTPCWGFSPFAVSGITMPDAVTCSASIGMTTTRSPIGSIDTESLGSGDAAIREKGKWMEKWIAVESSVC